MLDDVVLRTLSGLPLYSGTRTCDEIDPVFRQLTDRGLYDEEGCAPAYRHWTEVLSTLPSADRVARLVNDNINLAFDGECRETGLLLALLAIQSDAFSQLEQRNKLILISCFDFFIGSAHEVCNDKIQCDLGWFELGVSNMEDCLTMVREELVRAL